MQQFKSLILFLFGGTAYYFIEILWRGYSHPSIFILGGLCFILIGGINNYYSWEMPLWKQQGTATMIIIVLEFVVGVIVNIWLGLNVWDYSNLTFNLLGQVSLGYSFLWFFLSLVGILLDDYIRYWVFKEEKPRYVIF
jgi:uncharacterized membrane protein